MTCPTATPRLTMERASFQPCAFEYGLTGAQISTMRFSAVRRAAVILALPHQEIVGQNRSATSALARGDGSATMSLAPYQWHLYSSTRRNMPQPTSAIDRDNRSRPRPRTFRPSTTTAGLVVASHVVTLRRKSRRMFHTRCGNPAKRKTALAKLRDPLRFLLNCLERRRKILSILANGFGATIRVPSDSTRKNARPKSTPTGPHRATPDQAA